MTVLFATEEKECQDPEVDPPSSPARWPPSYATIAYLKPDEVAAMLGLYQVPAARREEIMQLVRESAEPGWWVARFGNQLPGQRQALIDYEGRAKAIFEYQPSGLPRL